MVAWGAVLATVLILTPLFRTLPEAVLAALIVHAVWHLIASRKLQRFRSLSTAEWSLGVLTFLGVILVDVLAGMVIGVISAMALVAFRSSRPHLAGLGAVPGVPGAFLDRERHDEVLPVPGLLIVRLAAPMYFANAQSVRDALSELLDTAQPAPRALVIDAVAQDSIDVTSAQTLSDIAADLQGRGIAMFAANLHEPVRAFLRDHEFLALPEGHDQPTLAAAVDAASAFAAAPAEADLVQP